MNDAELFEAAMELPASLGCPSLVPPVVVHDEPAPEDAPTLTGLAKFLHVHDGVQLIRFRGKDETRLVARRKGVSGTPNAIFEIVVDHQDRTAECRKDGRLLFAIYGHGCNYACVEKMSVSALHRWFKIQRPNRKKRRAKAAAKAAAKREGK